MQTLDLDVRVQRLQRLQRLTLLLAVVPWFAVGGLAWMIVRQQTTTPDVITSRAFVVQSDAGEAIARIASERGTGTVTLLGKNGREVLELSGSNQGVGTLSMFNADHKQIAWLGGEPSGAGNLTLSDRKGEAIVVARDNGEHQGSLSVIGADKKAIAYLGATSQGDGGLRTCNRNGATIAELNATEKGDPALTLTASGGHAFFAVGVPDDGEMSLQIKGAQSQSAYLATNERGGYLRFTDANAVERFRAGPMKNGLVEINVRDRQGNLVSSIGETEDGRGGGFRAYGIGESPAVFAGVDDREGAGIFTVFHPGGQDLFWAGLAGDKENGIISVKDVHGKRTLLTPAIPQR